MASRTELYASRLRVRPIPSHVLGAMALRQCGGHIVLDDLYAVADEVARYPFGASRAASRRIS